MGGAEAGLGGVVKPRRARPLKRLVDADPCWVDAAITVPEAGRRHGVILDFDCPIHEGCRLGVPVDPPIDGGEPMPELMAGKAWKRTGGEDFASVTLSPSIRILGGADGCEWHGFIRGGRFETCGDAR